MAYPTLAELKTHLGISGSSDDTHLTKLLNGAIEFVEHYTGRVFDGQADETRRYFARHKQHFAVRHSLMLFEDLATVTSLTHPRLGALTLNTHYILEPQVAPHYKISLLSDVFDFGSPTDAVVLVGKFGYSATCPDDIAVLILELAQSAYHGRNSGGGGDVMLVQGNSGAILRPKTLSELQVAVLESYKR